MSYKVQKFTKFILSESYCTIGATKCIFYSVYMHTCVKADLHGCMQPFGGIYILYILYTAVYIYIINIVYIDTCTYILKLSLNCNTFHPWPVMLASSASLRGDEFPCRDPFCTWPRIYGWNSVLKLAAGVVTTHIQIQKGMFLLFSSLWLKHEIYFIVDRPEYDINLLSCPGQLSFF